jgi:flagellar hook-associated protein 2
MLQPVGRGSHPQGKPRSADKVVVEVPAPEPRVAIEKEQGMSTSSITNSLLSSLGVSSNESISQLLGQSSTSSSASTNENSAIQDAVNAILNSATNTSGSGIDVTSTVDAILEIDAQPEINLQNQVTSLNSQTSALQTIQSDLTAFQTSLQALTDFSGDFGGLTVSSSNNDAVSATAVNGTATGTHTVSVRHLATTSADYSSDFSSASSALPTGQFALTVGSNSAVLIPVDSADNTNTLSGLASYINQNNLGVTASVITDSSGTRLGLESNTSGAAGQITLSNDSTSADYSGYFTSGSVAIPEGSFQMKVGSNAAVTIPVNSSNGTYTLNGLASYINQQSLGVTASVETNSSGARLLLIPQSSGAAGAITISTDTTNGGGGMGFTNVYNPSSPAVEEENGMGFQQAAAGQDASLSVDGIPVDSASNTVEGAIPGVTLTLSGLTTSGGADNPVTLQISPNLTPIATDINNFVSSWNTLIQAINSGIQYNSSTTAAGALEGDTSVDLVQQQLLSAISTGMTNNAGISNLQSIGIEMQDDGTLTVDSTTLNNALENNFSAVQHLFQSTTSGVGQALQSTLNSLTDTVSGPLAVDMSGISSQVTDLNSQISDFQLQLQDTQTQLLSEYNTINSTLEQLPETLASINSQLDALNPQKSSS